MYFVVVKNAVSHILFGSKLMEDETDSLDLLHSVIVSTACMKDLLESSLRSVVEESHPFSQAPID